MENAIAQQKLSGPTRPLTRKERMRAWVARNVKPNTTDTAQPGVQQTAEKRPA